MNLTVSAIVGWLVEMAMRVWATDAVVGRGVTHGDGDLDPVRAPGHQVGGGVDLAVTWWVMLVPAGLR